MIKVVDASYLLSLLIPDESTEKDAYERLFSGEFELVGPELLRFEVGNALLLAMKRKRITLQKAKRLVGLFADSPVEYRKTELLEVFLLAREKRLTVYDASYVWLARKLKVSLLTHDKKMLEVISD